jgi:hypothetical protein
MPTFNALADAINSRFKTLVADVVPVPTMYENFPFTPPNDSVWASLKINLGQAIQVSSGGNNSNRYRVVGVAVASIFVPIESGSDTALTVADVVVSAFRATSTTDVVYRTPSVESIGTSGKWWQFNVNIPFYSDTVG